MTTSFPPVPPGRALVRERRLLDGPRPGWMRAAVLVGPKRLQVEERRQPDPGAGEVRLRIEGCGLAASDVAAWEGRAGLRYPLEPGAPGHEAWGTVDALGPEVTALQEGDRVAFLSKRAFAQFDVASAAEVVRLPARLDDEPFPAPVLGGAFNVFRRSAIRPGDTVAVVGVGFLGALLVRIASRAQALVIGLSRRPFARDVARRSGAWATVPLDDDPKRVAAEVLALTGGVGCDRVIEASGRQDTLDLAAALTRPRGRLIVAGHHDGRRSVDMALWNDRGLDVVSAHERDPGVAMAAIRSAVDAELGGLLDCRPLYTHQFRLAELPLAFETARKRPDGFLKALVIP